MPEENPEILEDLRRAVTARDGSAFLSASEKIHYADLAAIYEELSRKSQAWFVRTLSSESFSEVIAEIPDPLVEEALDYLKPSQQRQVLEELPDDDRVDVLQDVEDERKREKLIGLLGAHEERELTRTLLEYPEDTAGGRMTTQIGNVSVSMTVKEALDHLRPDLEDTETLSSIFVHDQNNQLAGKLRLRDLTFNAWQTPVGAIMQPIEHTVLDDTDQEEASIAVLKYDMYALPVVDEETHLLGVI
ncbi:MAG: magnesium transporter, partial [Roseibacillus sp.]|nr:magnesium transporter [Roseibacillus sp.]